MTHMLAHSTIRKSAMRNRGILGVIGPRPAPIAASGKSKGVRLPSASEAVKAMKNATKAAGFWHANQLPGPAALGADDSLHDRVPAIMTGTMMAMPAGNLVGTDLGDPAHGAKSSPL